MTADLHLRYLDESDVPELCRLNTAAVPAVPQTSESEMLGLLTLGGHSFAMMDAGSVDGSSSDTGTATARSILGFVVSMNPGSPYDSENYRWFEQRGIDHLYIDRIVVDAASRSAGIGRSLYARAFAIARLDGRREVTCEVNLDPPNPRSLAFHARLGFEEVGRQRTKGGSVEVALLAASVPFAASPWESAEASTA